MSARWNPAVEYFSFAPGWSAPDIKRGNLNATRGQGSLKTWSFLDGKPLRSSAEICLRGLAEATLIKRLVTVINIYQRDEICATCWFLSLLWCASDKTNALLVSFLGPLLQKTLPGRRLQVHREGQEAEWRRAGHQLAKSAWEIVCAVPRWWKKTKQSSKRRNRQSKQGWGLR